MKALKEEMEREPERHKRKKLNEVGEIMCESKEEYNRVTNFVRENEYVSSWVGRDGNLQSEPNDAGLAWIEHQTEKWKPGRKLVFVLAIVGALVALLATQWF
jgi:hypothetical protein